MLRRKKSKKEKVTVMGEGFSLLFFTSLDRKTRANLSVREIWMKSWRKWAMYTWWKNCPSRGGNSKFKGPISKNMMGLKDHQKGLVAEMGYMRREIDESNNEQSRKLIMVRATLRTPAFFLHEARSRHRVFSKGVIWSYLTFYKIPMAAVLRTDFERGNGDGAGHKQEDQWQVWQWGVILRWLA